MRANERSDKPKYEFIVTTPTVSLDRDHQRRIKSHVTGTRRRQKGSKPLASWIGLDNPEPSTSQQQLNSSLGPSPRRVGSEFSWVQFPEPIKPYMHEDIAKFLTVVKDQLYPTAICIEIESVDSSWVGCVLRDKLYLHSMLFSTEVYFDEFLGRNLNPVTHFHGIKALRLLQERVSTPNDPLAISDETIMTVVTLAMTADVLGDEVAVANHMEGLRTMVKLRGGIRSLGSNVTDLAVKVCWVDLAWALHSGCRPYFFRHGISWDPYVTGLAKGSSAVKSHDSKLSGFLECLDERLVTVWKDLQRFTDISNVASQTGYKLPMTTFSEIMVSILYRLLHMPTGDSTIQDAIRAGMIAFTACIFFRWKGLKHKQRHGRFIDEFDSALHRLRNSSSDIPQPLQFWLLMVWSMFAVLESPDKNHPAWLVETTELLHISSWKEARVLLKSIMWIDSLNDAAGESIFNVLTTKLI